MMRLDVKKIAHQQKVLDDCLRDGFPPPGVLVADTPSAVQEAARRLGLAASTVRSALSDGKLKINASLYKKGGDGKRAKEAELVGEISRLKRLLASQQKEAIDMAHIRSGIYQLANISPKPPKWTFPSGGGSNIAEVPIVLWSDWHIGEVVKPEEVAGVNAFNLDIAEKRIKALVENTIHICYDHRRNTEYPGIVVCLGGDMLSGDDLHAELTETNQLKTLPILQILFDWLVAALEILVEKFGNVYVVGVVGNHGRNTHKPRYKGRIVTNYEWHLYCLLERFFSDDKRFSFLIPAEADAHFTVLGHRYCLTHGDTLGVKGGDGFIGILGPVRRGEIKMRRSEGQVSRDFDTLLMGHWHQYTPLVPSLIVNGSLKGYDEYARLCLRATFEQPQQALWFTHPQRGITTCYAVAVDNNSRTGKTKEPFVAINKPAPQWYRR